MTYRPLEIAGHFQTEPSLCIRFNGKNYSARPGEPLGFTLLAHGEYVLGRSSKYHRPRGLFCARQSCGNCVARVDGLPNRRLCAVAATCAHEVEAQNTLGSPRFDLLGSIDYVFAGGLDHHHLMTQVGFINRIAVASARQLAGLGHLPSSIPDSPCSLRQEHVPVVVVGAGPAGRAAAQAIRQNGLRTVLIDAAAGESDHADTHFNARAIGFYDDRYLVVVTGQQLWRLRADTFVLATGAYEQPPASPGNDKPGVLSLRAAELALSYGILPGRKFALAIDVDADASTRLAAQKFAHQASLAGATCAVALNAPDIEATSHASSLRKITGTAPKLKVFSDDASFAVDTLIWCERPTPAYELARNMGVLASWRDNMFALEVDSDGRTLREGVWVTGELAGAPRDQAQAHGERVGRAITLPVARDWSLA